MVSNDRANASRWTAGALGAVLLLFSSGWLGAEPPSGLDWAALGSERVVQVVTRNPDGTPRTTKIWIVVVGGEPYIRTGSTRWHANLERDPNLILRIAGREIPLRVEPVTEPELAERIERAFRAKYGVSDWLVGWIRFGEVHLMHLVPRRGGDARAARPPARPPDPW